MAEPEPVLARRAALLGAVGTAAALASPQPAPAKLVDYLLPSQEKVEEVSMVLGSPDGDLAFYPDKLEFVAGRVYKLKLTNPAKTTHYFTSYEFAEKVFTILVLAGDPAVEVKGAISEVALKAGASATWIFMAIKPGTYPLKCTVKGHDAMRGTLVIKRA